MALIRPATRFDSETRTYDGQQLRSHWIYEEFGIQGDAIVSFVGPAEVRGEHLVDLADRRDGLFIAADEMLHFIVESFEPRLDRAVFLQRLLVMSAQELIGRSSEGPWPRRSGDDLFLGEGKLSVSIATVSAVSNLVHFGINVRQDGTPVTTAALHDRGLRAEDFARDLMHQVAEDLEGMGRAMTKVRPVQ
jgi:uncharacterized protein